MVKLSKYFWTLALILSLAAGCNKPVDSNDVTTSSAEIVIPYTTPLQIGGQQIYVEVADTDAARQQGLSGRKRLTDNQGLLFDFRNTDLTRPGFWMKDMVFDLDLIWIKELKVVAITPDVPAPKNTGEQLPTYLPPSEIDMVLEVVSGWSRAHNIKAGDLIKF